MAHDWVIGNVNVIGLILRSWHIARMSVLMATGEPGPLLGAVLRTKDNGSCIKVWPMNSDDECNWNEVGLVTCDDNCEVGECPMVLTVCKKDSRCENMWFCWLKEIHAVIAKITNDCIHAEWAKERQSGWNDVNWNVWKGKISTAWEFSYGGYNYQCPSIKKKQVYWNVKR